MQIDALRVHALQSLCPLHLGRDLGNPTRWCDGLFDSRVTDMKEKTKRQKENAKRRYRTVKIAITAWQLERFFGKEVACEYLKSPNKRLDLEDKVKDYRPDRNLYPPKYQNASSYIIGRIDALNLIGRKLIGNVGWACSECLTVIYDPSGVEMDHIKGWRGRIGYQPRNFQILCLECHKAKTVKEHKEYFQKKREKSKASK